MKHSEMTGCGVADLCCVLSMDGKSWFRHRRDQTDCSDQGVFFFFFFLFFKFSVPKCYNTQINTILQ